MSLLCEETASILDCDRSSVLLWDGEKFRGTYNWGNPPDIASGFTDYSVGIDFPLLDRIYQTRSYEVVNDARSDRVIQRIAGVASIESIVVAPMFDEKGEPLGFMTAEFNDRLGSFDDARGAIVMGAARLGQGTILGTRERRRRRQSGVIQRQLLERLVVSEDRERRNISANIHDDPLQRIIAVMHRIESSADRATDEAARAELLSLASDAEAAARSLRDLIQDVHPASIDFGGLSGAIETTLSRLAKKNGWNIEFVDRVEDEIPTTVANVLYRVTQQALQNIAIHAEASTVRVEIHTDEARRETSVSVEDNGRGFDESAVARDRYGLIAMRERIRYANGEMDLRTAPGAGTALRFSVSNVP